MNFIVQSRIRPRALPSGIVNREKLLKKISEGFKKTLVFVCAPAGYGKTTLLQQYLAKSNVKYSWLDVKEDMGNFYTFMTYLTQSVRQSNPDFGTAVLEMMKTYQEEFQLSKSMKRIVSDIVNAFLSEFCQCFKDDVIVVIDDLGNLNDPEWLSSAFGNMFGSIPSNLHFVITTRQMVQINLGTLQAKRNLLKIDAEDLMFRDDEIEELLRDVYDILCSKEEVSVLRNNSNGWITGIHLILQSYGVQFAKIRLDKNIILEDVFNYFTEDIFSHLSENVQDLLLKTSLLDNFTPHLCDELLGTTGSKKIIQELLRKNVFIQMSYGNPEDTEAVYTYQLLFKKFLSSKLYELKSEKEIDVIYRRICKYYSGKKDYLRAINYALETHDNETAVPLILEHFQYYFDLGNFEALSKWFELLDEKTVTENTYLAYFKSLILRFYEGNPEKSMAFIDKAIELREPTENDSFFIKCCIQKSRSLLILGKITETISYLEEILSRKTDNTGRIKLLYLMAYAHYQNTNYDKSIQLLDEAVRELESEKTSGLAKDSLPAERAGTLDIFNLYGHIFLIRGEYSRAIPHYEQVAKREDKIIDRYVALTNLVLLYAQCGKFEKSLEYLSQAKAVMERIQIPIFTIAYLLAYQALLFEYGDYEGSISVLGEINDIATKINHKYYIYLSYSLIADSNYYLNKLSVTEDYLDRAFKYVNEESQLEKAQYAVMKALMLKKSELLPSVENALLEAFEYYNKNIFIHNKMQAAFHLADFYLRKNELKSAYRYLDEALRIASEKEYVSDMQREITHLRYLFDFALANNVKKGFIIEITQTLLIRKDEPWISAECRRRVEITRESFRDVQMKTFGKGVIKVRGRLVSEAGWSKRKWKHIFIYLMLNSKKGMTKDKIIDAFYPETSIESAGNIFYQIVSKFKNLIKIDSDLLPEGGERRRGRKARSRKNDLEIIPQIIVYEDGVLGLNEDLSYEIDAAEFEKYYGLSSKEKDKNKKAEHMKKAIALYKGEFMEGCYDTWCEELRTSYKSHFATMSEELTKQLFESKMYADCIHYAENLLVFDKVNLQAYEYLIKSYMRLDKIKLSNEKRSLLISEYKKEYGEKLPSSVHEKLKSWETAPV